MHPRLPARRPVGIAVPTASKRSASALLAAALLASSTDLGPSRSADTQITVTLDEAARPDALIDWSEARNLSVRWRPGDGWAIVEGAAGDLGRAFGVPVHDYRALKGKVFYASPSQPAVPSVLHGVVTAVGRIMSYAPHHTKAPGFLPLDVPAGGLTPAGLLSVYNASPLVDAGFTGEGATIVIFSFDSAGQEDPDLFADTSVLPRFTPEIVGGKPAEKHGETAMDLQVAHAIAPDARLVVVNARPTVEGDGAYEKLGRLFESVDRDYPGAVWSLSIGWGCEVFVSAADLAPVEAALAAAQRRVVADDDLGRRHHAVDGHPRAVAGRRRVGGSPVSQGSSGGVSKLFARPPFTRLRLIVMVAVHNDYALVASAIGPYREFSRDLGTGHPWGANLQLAMDMGRYVNSFQWGGGTD